MITIYTNIRFLAGAEDNSEQRRGADLNNLKILENAFLVIEDGRIRDYGEQAEFQQDKYGEDSEIITLTGQSIIPCWADSHTHLVFAGSREDEFVDKLNGLSYAEIAARGGGILNSAKKMGLISEDDLLEITKEKLNKLIRLGTGSIEIKSGYGLTVEAELKMLRVIKKLKEYSPIPIKATFLGAHTYPPQFKNDHQGYINMITKEMLPKIAEEKLADFVDVFCEEGFFSVQETIEICEAAKQHGLQPKLHVNQLNSIGGIEAGIEQNALSLDHLETLTEKDIELLGRFRGCSTLLPTAAYFLRMPYQPARKLIDAGAAVTLASDYNPGSSPSGNMNFVASMSCIQMKMLPNEVINAATINGAFAMNLENETGNLGRGKRANFIITKSIPSLSYLFYSFGENLVEKVIINGKKFEE